MHTIEVEAPPVGDPRLKRWMVHDDRARAYSLAAAKAPPKIGANHRRRLPFWDQGDVGDCTANAGYGVLACEPFFHISFDFTEASCLALYKMETQLDDSVIPGRYPPIDTGSTGWYSFKALKIIGLVKGYAHAFGLNAVLNSLVKNAGSLGVPWYDSMMDVDRSGFLRISPNAQLVGGHQICASAVDPADQSITIDNSWGPGWGLKGRARMKWDVLDQLLHEGGDYTVPVL